MKTLFLLLATSTYLVHCIPPPHPSVVAVRQEEELLPPYLRSPALHNRNLQKILPLTSLLHKGEQPVFERAADNVPRKEIYKILTHAGLVARKQSHQLSIPQKNPVSQSLFHDPPFFPTQDLLQYL